MINTWNPAEISDKLNQLEGQIQANDVIANPTGEATETLTKIGIDGDIYSFTAETTAADVSYDNTSSGLTADDVQEAIDEITTRTTVAEKTATGTGYSVTYTEIIRNGVVQVAGTITPTADHGAGDTVDVTLELTTAPRLSTPGTNNATVSVSDKKPSAYVLLSTGKVLSIGGASTENRNFAFSIVYLK